MVYIRDYSQQQRLGRAKYNRAHAALLDEAERTMRAGEALNWRDVAAGAGYSGHTVLTHFRKPANFIELTVCHALNKTLSETEPATELSFFARTLLDLLEPFARYLDQTHVAQLQTNLVWLLTEKLALNSAMAGEYADLILALTFMSSWSKSNELRDSILAVNMPLNVS